MTDRRIPRVRARFTILEALKCSGALVRFDAQGTFYLLLVFLSEIGTDLVKYGQHVILVLKIEYPHETKKKNLTTPTSGGGQIIVSELKRLRSLNSDKIRPKTSLVIWALKFFVS